MTGYASHELSTENGVLQVELRSVNQRYLELHLKVEDRFRSQEPHVRELLKAKLGRGKVECRINLAKSELEQSSLTINQAVLKQIAESVEAVSARFPEVQAVNPIEVLRMPGVLATETIDQEALVKDVHAVLAETTEELIAARVREGEKLAAMILERLAEVEALVISVKPKMPAMVKAYREKLLTKLQEAQQSNDDERIRQEVVLFTQRIDVDEELSRLDAHVNEVKRILSVGGLAGKKLDFLMQEMNREANTLGSKSVSIDTTQISMQLKVLIEQMREQIQNIE